MTEVHRSALDLQYIQLKNIKPYPHNPRDNQAAIPALMQSIQQFGFRIPAVVDKDMVIVAGHTRIEAAKRLGMTEVPCFIAHDLNDEQIKAFRLVDNKTAELADWDFDLLAGEVNALADAGIDLMVYGWTSEEIDCLREVVQEDALDSETIGELAKKVEGDGVNGVIASKRFASGHVTHDSLSVRIAIGEFNFFLATEDYRAWAEELRRKNAYDRTAITHDLAERLGMLKQVQDHDRRSVAKSAERSGKLKEEMNARLANDAATITKKRKEGAKLDKAEELAEAGLATSSTEAAAAVIEKKTRKRKEKPVGAMQDHQPEAEVEAAPVADAPATPAVRTRKRVAA